MQIFILAGVVVLSLIIAIASVGGVLAVLLRFMRHPVNSPAPSWGRGDGTVLTRPVGGDIAA